MYTHTRRRTTTTADETEEWQLFFSLFAFFPFTSFDFWQQQQYQLQISIFSGGRSHFSLFLFSFLMFQLASFHRPRYFIPMLSHYIPRDEKMTWCGEEERVEESREDEGKHQREREREDIQQLIDFRISECWFIFSVFLDAAYTIIPYSINIIYSTYRSFIATPNITLISKNT